MPQEAGDGFHIVSARQTGNRASVTPVTRLANLEARLECDSDTITMHGIQHTSMLHVCWLHVECAVQHILPCLKWHSADARQVVHECLLNKDTAVSTGASKGDTVRQGVGGGRQAVGGRGVGRRKGAGRGGGGGVGVGAVPDGQ